jgi:hypothetical protein
VAASCLAGGGGDANFSTLALGGGGVPAAPVLCSGGGGLTAATRAARFPCAGGGGDAMTRIGMSMCWLGGGGVAPAHGHLQCPQERHVQHRGRSYASAT